MNHLYNMRYKNFLLYALMSLGFAANAQELVILHTNDTHSQLDPTDKNRGGILRRKALVDSVRAAQPNVLLIDAGDAVQGTLYFTLFEGEAERKMMNNLGYDIQILGNHEFDNGTESLARQWKDINAEKIATNYDLSGTPLEGIFKPYTVKEYDGKKVGIIAINLEPKGMIDDAKSVNVKYLDGIEAANAMAWYLKNILHTDKVVAVTHVGYKDSTPPTPSDVDIARASKDIDIIIGGHSHTEVKPEDPENTPCRIPNANGDTVLVAQTGGRGENLGEITVNFDNNTTSYRLIPVDKRLDNRIDSEAAALLASYRTQVDSLKKVKIGRMAQELPAGSTELLNWVADVMLTMGQKMVDEPIDLAIVNKGGIRRGLPAGDITKELIMTMLPFDNHLNVMEIKGSDLIEAFNVMEKRGGDGISKGFNWKETDPEHVYRLLTIDYLAHGGDYMESLKNGKITYVSPKRLDETVIEFLENSPKKPIKYTDNTPRM